MNTVTLNTITGVLGLINPALGLIGSFVGSAATSESVTKITSQVQDAVGVVTALAPIVQQFGNGEEVTPADVQSALDGMDAALATFDKLIAEK